MHLPFSSETQGGDTSACGADTEPRPIPFCSELDKEIQSLGPGRTGCPYLRKEIPAFRSPKEAGRSPLCRLGAELLTVGIVPFRNWAFDRSDLARRGQRAKKPTGHRRAAERTGGIRSTDRETVLRSGPANLRRPERGDCGSEGLGQFSIGRMPLHRVAVDGGLDIGAGCRIHAARLLIRIWPPIGSRAASSPLCSSSPPRSLMPAGLGSGMPD